MKRSSGVGGLLVVVLLATFGAAYAAQPSVGLGTATSFAILAGQTVTNTGPSDISGDVGVSPGSAVTGFPPGQVRDGTIHAADEVAAQAQADLTTAYDDAAGRSPSTPVSSDLGGQTLAPGVYKSEAAMGLTGTVTLDGQDDPNSVFIFQAGSTLITASSSTVALIRGANLCNVFWQVGSSATLGTDSVFVGTIMALTSATVQTRATVQGRVLARNGQASLDDNTVSRPACESTTTPSTSTPTTQPGSPGGGDGGNGSGPGGTGPGGDTGGGSNGPGPGNGGDGGGATTTTTVRPENNLIPPVVMERPPPTTVNTPDDGAAIPRTGAAVAPTLTLGVALVVLGALSIWRAHGADT